MIVEASKKHTDYQAVCGIFEVVTDCNPVPEAPVVTLRRQIKHALAFMSNREIGIKYDALKNKGLI
jgi:hypothetical protein